MKTEELKDKILKEYKKGNIVISTVDGLSVAPLKEVIKQPTEGLLYDINRDEATILTLIGDPKWVNDYACMAVIRELKKQVELSESFTKEHAIEFLKAEIQKYVSDPINRKIVERKYTEWINNKL